ncbi:MAG: hypothetical protein L3J59_03870 [Methylococcaceae bacterium]|nr:hypothetical protein [Methylococcaceae bacterium]
MALFGGINKKSTLKASIKQTAKARSNEGAKADQLYISAYQGFADVVKGDLVTGEALFNWGFALLHQAKTKEEDSVRLYLEAISKFNFCLLVTPNHLGAAIDGGVAYMDLARIMQINADDELYDLAGEFFENAERIQRGSATYNLACIYGLRGQEDACLEALELSRECGSLPSAEDILSDTDLIGVKDTQWFVDFMEKVTAEPEPEVIDEGVVRYDVEGNVIRKKEKKQFENEVDGVVYDVEGNVIRRVEPEVSSETSKDVDKTENLNTEVTKVAQKEE